MLGLILEQHFIVVVSDLDVQVLQSKDDNEVLTARGEKSLCLSVHDMPLVDLL